MKFGNVLVMDGETTVQQVQKYRPGEKEQFETDGSPFHPDNYLVSMHTHRRDLFGFEVENVTNHMFRHNELDRKDAANPADLQAELDWADMVVAHNAKFDIQWLVECGFRIPSRVWDTMLVEYILARGRPVQLSLKEVAKVRNVTRKREDVTEDYFKKGVGFEAMPIDIVKEYAATDVVSCGEIFDRQQDLLAMEENQSLWPVIEAGNDMLIFLSEMEANGVPIDLDKLDEVEVQYRAEKEQLEADLEKIASEVMGDWPINFNSGIDMSEVIYSRRITDKKLHHEVFNIGTQPNGKPKYAPRMTKARFAGAVRATSRVLKRATVEHCFSCNGRGKEFKLTKAGKPHKRPPKCRDCQGKGVIYRESGNKIAGLKLSPERASDATFHGFTTAKDNLSRLKDQARRKGNDTAVVFLEKMERLNAVSTYLSSFVGGIKTWTRATGLLHANFNQTVTNTARLSSTRPNFQNQPKGGKFPVRKAVVSRFQLRYQEVLEAMGVELPRDEDGNVIEGEILEADYSGLEFRVAGELSLDDQILSDVRNGKDTHKQTASIINECSVLAITADMRQGAKPYTFAPLYGGKGANEPPHIQKYFQEFFVIYSGMARWHKELFSEVLKTGKVRTPSGREYAFPGTKRTKTGVTNSTQIVNYPVQGYGNDIVQLACIRARRAFREMGLTSLIILTVHDSIVVDVFPGEREQVLHALKWAMAEVHEETFTRWGHYPVLPLDIEAEAGSNWMEQDEVELPEAANVPAPLREPFKELEAA